MRMTYLTGLAAIAGFGAMMACGGGSSSTSTNPSPTPTPGTTITITAAGANPRSLEVTIGSQVTFINNDTRTHEMTSDPHPEHTDCTELNSVGFLQPGQQRLTGNLVRARTCGFHDHGLPDTNSLKGTIVIR